jgi:hypothetical protein
MKQLILISILLFPISLCSGEMVEKSEKADPTAGFIDIVVQSNVNSILFEYDIEGKCLFNTNGIKTKYENNPSGLRILVPVKEFKVTNQSVYKDFLTLVRADQFPYLEIYIPRNPETIIPEDGTGVLKNVSITVAGISKKYDINCRLENNDDNNEILLGVSRLRLTDFGLEPPVKFYGLVKVKDEIIVKFGFCMQKTAEAVKSI